MTTIGIARGTSLSNWQSLVNGTPANMILDIRVQPGGAGAAKQLIDYGAQRGVAVSYRLSRWALPLNQL